VIIITKCPKDLSEITQKEIKAKIGVEAPVFFSYIDYDDLVYNQNESKKLSEVMSLGKIVVAGIAKPEPFFKHLNAVNDECLVFPDHHFFTANDIQQIEDKAKNKIIITTEKDFVRLSNQNLKAPIYYLPINSSFLSKSEELDNKIKNYVGSSSRNR
jgi:tetraacyldisaccharide 4'-kinase